jgi:hypothetical protein
MKTTRAILAVASVVLFGPGHLRAQGGRAGAPQPPRTAKAIAPIDVSGYWISLIVDEWRFRVTPVKGDILYLPLNAEARKVAEAWDPAKDQAEGNQCRAYGAVGVMQRPGRLHVAWDDENTLKIDADAGTQTRTLHFGTAQAPAGEPSWQGYSIAQWQGAAGAVLANGAGGGRGPAAPPKTGTLKVTTTNMRPGYIRKNGVPYSNKAVLTEYMNRIAGKDGEPYLVVTAMVDDPVYLNGPFIRTYTFKSAPDNTGWDPTPCWPK